MPVECHAHENWPASLSRRRELDRARRAFGMFLEVFAQRG
jgi:hypothetical protein